MKKIIICIVFIILIIISLFFSVRHILSRELKGKEWIVVRWIDDSVEPNVSEIILRFENDFKIKGNGGVNIYSGTYYIGINEKLSFDNIASTEMASTDPIINKAESIYFELLLAVKYYKLENNKLILLDKDRNEIIVLSNRK